MAAATAEDQRRLLPLHGDHHQRRDYHSIPIRPSGNSADESFSNASSFSTSSSSSSTSSTAYPSYSYLILSHALGLIPSLLFLALFAGFALRIPCRLPLPSASCRLPSTEDENVAASEQRCAALLGPGSMLSWSLFLLSVAAFTAAHKVRNLISRLCTLAIRLARACSSSSAAARGGAGSGPPDEASRYDVLAKDEEDTAATIFSFVSRAFFTEGFKILLVVVASAVVLAKTFVDGSRDDSSPTSPLSSSLGATPLRHHSSRHDAIPRLTKLDGHDGRFRIAVWLALGWATAELLSGTVQLFRQLSMYSPTLMDEAGGAFLLGGGEEEDGEEEEEGGRGLVLEEGDERVVEGEHAAVDPPDSPSSIYRGHTGQANGTGHETNSTPHATTLSSARQQLQHRQRRPSSAAPPAPPPLDPTAIQRLESQIDRLIAARTRVKLERTLGASLMELPVAISAVWRLDSALWSTGSVLLLSAAVALGQGVGMFDVDGTGTRRVGDEEGVRLFPRLGSLYVTFTILAALYAVFHSVWRLALASWGVTYPSLLVGLGMVVSGLARWGLVV